VVHAACLQFETSMRGQECDRRKRTKSLKGLKQKKYLLRNWARGRSLKGRGKCGEISHKAQMARVGGIPSGVIRAEPQVSQRTVIVLRRGFRNSYGREGLGAATYRHRGVSFHKKTGRFGMADSAVLIW
jgi:hypothetical protein